VIAGALQFLQQAGGAKMTETDWAVTAKWTLKTYDRLVEAFRSATNEESREEMLHVIGKFGSSLKMPDEEETVPDEYKTLMDDWKQVHTTFRQWAMLSRMASIISSAKCLLSLGHASQGIMWAIENLRSEWLQMPNLEETVISELADDYRSLKEKWKPVERRILKWQLQETHTVGSA
jgi:hypothetical protein